MGGGLQVDRQASGLLMDIPDDVANQRLDEFFKTELPMDSTVEEVHKKENEDDKKKDSLKEQGGKSRPKLVKKEGLQNLQKK